MLRKACPISVIALVVCTLGFAPQASAAGCDLVVSPDGSSVAEGTLAHPFEDVSQLVESLEPGQVGCVKQGVYQFDEVIFDTPGVTLTSYPGERATLEGRIWIARDADGTTITDLNLDGRGPSADSASPTINADNVTLSNNDITNHHTAICIAIGSLDPEYGRATGTVVENNQIHNCGVLPALNHDHGIYLEAATNTVIRGNWIYDNADRGIQLYPDADGTLITENVIDGNGEGIIFSGDHGVASNNNVVERNVITNSRVRHNIESSYPEDNPIGDGNVVRYNCIYGAEGWYGEGDHSAIESSEVGFTAANNLIADPAYVNRAGHDYTLRADSPCRDLGRPVKLTPGNSHADRSIQVRGELPQASDLPGDVVTVLAKKNGRWVKLARRKVTKAKFRLRLRLPRGMRGGKTVRLRAEAPGRIPSRTVRIETEPRGQSH